MGVSVAHVNVVLAVDGDTNAQVKGVVKLAEVVSVVVKDLNAVIINIDYVEWTRRITDFETRRVRSAPSRGGVVYAHRVAARARLVGGCESHRELGRTYQCRGVLRVIQADGRVRIEIRSVDRKRLRS